MCWFHINLLLNWQITFFGHICNSESLIRNRILTDKRHVQLFSLLDQSPNCEQMAVSRSSNNPLTTDETLSWKRVHTQKRSCFSIQPLFSQFAKSTNIWGETGWPWMTYKGWKVCQLERIACNFNSSGNISSCTCFWLHWDVHELFSSSDNNYSATFTTQLLVKWT